ncbi:MAG: protein kinase [Planctomycetota bacterium]
MSHASESAAFVEAARTAGLRPEQLTAIEHLAHEALQTLGDWAVDLGATLVRRGTISAHELDTIRERLLVTSGPSHQKPVSEMTLLDLGHGGHSGGGANPDGGSEATLVDSFAPESAPGGGEATRDEADRYVYGAVIGAGGVGEIRQVTDLRIGRQVAMKTLHKPDHRPHRLRFEREAQITGQLEHPFIVPVHEAATDAHGRPYFTMKLVRGRNLFDWLKQHATADTDGRLLGDKLDIFNRICDAVAYAHAKGVIHRDLKPHNVMIGEFGEVLVMDWGLAARIGIREEGDVEAAAAAGGPVQLDRDHQTRMIAHEIDKHLTADGALIGTPAYMPPEQALGEITRLDGRADIYSLGAILYEMLTHHAPFDGTDTLDVLRKVMAGELIGPAARAPERNIPARLDAVVRKAMARRPADRYSTVAEFQADVRRLSAARLEGEIKLSRPITDQSALAVIALGRTSRIVQMAMNGILEKIGMRIEDGNLLRIVSGSGDNGIGIRDTWSRMVSYAADITGMFASLHTRGLIEPVPGDHKPVKWRCTPAGHAQSNISRDALNPYVGSLLSDLTGDELVQLIGLLDRARDSIERHAVMPPPPAE